MPAFYFYLTPPYLVKGQESSESLYQSPIERQLRPMLETTLAALGYEIVRISLLEGQRRTLQLMAERKDGADITVEDCADISHTISAILDVEDPIDGHYDLEVSSPGMDRPLVKARDFADFTGYEARVEMQVLVEGRKRFKGPIVSADDVAVTLNVDGQEFVLDYERMQAAKLVLTDELVRESLRRSKDKESLRSGAGVAQGAEITVNESNE